MNRKLLFILLTPFLYSYAQKTQKPNFKDEFLSHYVEIPSGRLIYSNQKPPDSVNSFYISKGEISNQDYHIFYNEFSITATSQEKEIISLDTSKWESVLDYGKPFTNFYYSHPAYNNYPCVNITHNGAVLYCKWLENKLNNTYKDYVFIVRLPTFIEWVYAAKGGKLLAPYPWGGSYLRNCKGQKLCNFKHSPDSEFQCETLESKSNNNKDIVAPSISYLPNDYGVYNTSGNVSEMIDSINIAMGGSWIDTYDKVTNTSIQSIVTPSPTVGFRPVILFKKR